MWFEKLTGFSENSQWIFDAIKKAIDKFSNTPLDIKIVSYGNSNLEVRAFVEMVKL